MTGWQGAEASERLARVLSDAVAIGRSEPTRPAHEVLFKALDISDAENFVALRRMSRFWCHPIAIRRDVLRTAEPLGAEPLATLARIEGHFAKGVQGAPWGTWMSALGASAVPDLRAIGRFLDSAGRITAASVPLYTILRFRKRLLDCLEDISSMSIPSGLSDYFEENLVALVDAFDDYRVSGLIGIDNAVTQAVASYPAIASQVPTRTGRLKDALVSITAAAALIGVVTQDAQQVYDLVDKLPWVQTQDELTVNRNDKSTTIEIGSGDGKQKLTIDFNPDRGK